MRWCTCAHTDEEHEDEERAKEFPGSSACTIEGCDCECFDEGEEPE